MDRPRLGDERVDQLTIADLRAWAADMVDEGISQHRRRECIIELRSMFKASEMEERIPHNPARLLKVPAKPKKDARAVPPDLLPQLLDTPDDALSLAIRIAADTGARRSNVLGLRFDSLSGNVLRFAEKVLSTGQVLQGQKERENGFSLGIADSTAEAIRAYKLNRAEVALSAGIRIAPDAWLFSDEVDHSIAITGSRFEHRWRLHRDRLGLKGIVQFKGLRHLCASALIEAGVDRRPLSWPRNAVSTAPG